MVCRHSMRRGLVRPQDPERGGGRRASERQPRQAEALLPGGCGAAGAGCAAQAPARAKPEAAGRCAQQAAVRDPTCPAHARLHAPR